MRHSDSIQWPGGGSDSGGAVARMVGSRRIRPLNERQLFRGISPVDRLTFKSVERGLFASIHSRQYGDHSRLVSKRQVCTCWGDRRRGYNCMCIELRRVSLWAVARTLTMSHLVKLVDIRIRTIDDIHKTLVRNDNQTGVFLW